MITNVNRRLRQLIKTEMSGLYFTEKQPALNARDDMPTSTDKEIKAKSTLEFLNQSSDGRLGDAHHLCGAGYAAGNHHGTKGINLAKSNQGLSPPNLGVFD
tara:strand:+ start:575 stop:877 length:303 start_codon:yes stop_codon:yes gene_type:complete